MINSKLYVAVTWRCISSHNWSCKTIFFFSLSLYLVNIWINVAVFNIVMKWVSSDDEYEANDGRQQQTHSIGDGDSGRCNSHRYISPWRWIGLHHPFNGWVEDFHAWRPFYLQKPNILHSHHFLRLLHGCWEGLCCKTFSKLIWQSSDKLFLELYTIVTY